MTETNAPVHNQPQPAPVKRNEVLRFVYVLNIVSCFAVVLLHTIAGVQPPADLALAGDAQSPVAGDLCGTGVLHGQRHESSRIPQSISDFRVLP
ncbi:hypothetical protein PMS18_09895 [Bifidobacterium longum]|nr:hypothetical protein [Bifidobacterium longum]